MCRWNSTLAASTLMFLSFNFFRFLSRFIYRFSFFFLYASCFSLRSLLTNFLACCYFSFSYSFLASLSSIFCTSNKHASNMFTNFAFKLILSTPHNLNMHFCDIVLIIQSCDNILFYISFKYIINSIQRRKFFHFRKRIFICISTQLLFSD